MPNNSRILRNALGSFATGVTIVTTRSSTGGDIGRTANSFSSVSLDPPMILWSLSKTSSSFADFRDADHFAVHILAADQDHLSGLFASKTEDKFANLTLERGADDIPLLKECAARFECRTVHQYEGGDHIIFVGQIIDFRHSQTPPLIFHGGQYGLMISQKDEDGNFADKQESLSPNDFIYLISRVFYRIREKAVAERRRRGWSGADYAILQLLGHEDGRTLQEIRDIGQARGDEIAEETTEGLQAKGLVVLTNAAHGGEKRAFLTDAGRRQIIEIVAMLKASEAECLAPLDENEIRILRQLLRQLATTQAAGWPPLPRSQEVERATA